MENCPLCKILKKKSYRIILQDNNAFSILNRFPLTKGHSMVIPKRHTLMEDLTKEELESINKQLSNLKNKLINLFPEKSPLIVIHTSNASIPEHFHVHIIPSEAPIRTLMSNYDKNIKRKEEADKSELKEVAELLKK